MGGQDDPTPPQVLLRVTPKFFLGSGDPTAPKLSLGSERSHSPANSPWDQDNPTAPNSLWGHPPNSLWGQDHPTAPQTLRRIRTIPQPHKLSLGSPPSSLWGQDNPTPPKLSANPQDPKAAQTKPPQIPASPTPQDRGRIGVGTFQQPLDLRIHGTPARPDRDRSEEEAQRAGTPQKQRRSNFWGPDSSSF